MARWTVGAARDLPIVERDSWDGPAAQKRMFGDGEEINEERARRGHLLYDAEEPSLRGSYKLPFADVVDGRLVAVDAGIQAANNRISSTDASPEALDRARSAMNGYMERMDRSQASMPAADSAGAVVVVQLAKENVEGDKPFAFLRTGKFRDMWGRDVEFDESFFDDLVANFGQDQAEPEIPIDVDHAMAEAAGWIVSIYREQDRLLARPRWNELGRQLVGDKRYRYVSATLDLKRKVLLSVSLTNFPAVSGLEPVSLSLSPVLETTETDVPDEQAPIDHGGIMNEDQEVTEVVEEDEPVEEIEEPTPEEDIDPKAWMAQLRAEFQDNMQKQMSEFRAAIVEDYRNSEKERDKIVSETLAVLRREQEDAEFSKRITTSGRYALPVEPDAIAQLLSKLPAAFRNEVRDVFDTIYKNGTVDFTETGTSAGDEEPVLLELSAEMKEALKKALADGLSKEEFFGLNADLLASMDAYDLSEFDES